MVPLSQVSVYTPYSADNCLCKHALQEEFFTDFHCNPLKAFVFSLSELTLWIFYPASNAERMWRRPPHSVLMKIVDPCTGPVPLVFLHTFAQTNKVQTDWDF